MNSKMNHVVERPPIVVVMGHVDHGKSTLLDYIRKSKTVEREAGGITQHVAAYEVEREKKGVKKHITFIDTPGHAAFKTIRARGANVADIAILVVAADDGVKAQTLEALASIKESEIPFIVAINKIDKPNANIERTQASLLEQGIYLEKLGGEVPWAAISAKEGTGVEELLDLILLVAEVQEFKGDAGKPAEGYVIEAHRDAKRGLAATLIITNGTIASGTAILAGQGIAPVRIMESTGGASLREASFSKPIRIVGFDQLPEVGASFSVYKNKREAEAARPEAIQAAAAIQTKEGDEKTNHFAMPVIVRADTFGSLEALEHELVKLGDEHSSVRIVQSGVGAVSENDIKTAVAGTTSAIIIGFNTKIDSTSEEYARQHGIRVEMFDIIYKLTERVEELLKENRPKRSVEEILGRAKVLKQFSSRKEIQVVGGSVSEGYISRGAQVRVIRRTIVVGIGKIKNLQAHKTDVGRVESGSEFGAQITSQMEITQGDTLECFMSSFQ